MPIYADPRRGPAIRLVADYDMTLLAQFVASPGEHPVANYLTAIPDTDLVRMAHLVVRDLPGVRAVTGIDEATELVKLGATVVRSSAFLGRHLSGDQQPPERWAAPLLPAGYTTGPLLTDDVERYYQAQIAAYPVGHPDHDGTVICHKNGLLRLILSGKSEYGPVLEDLSAEVRDSKENLVAAVLVTDWDGGASQWPGGPFVVDLFRSPGTSAGHGIGLALLKRAVAVASLSQFGGIGLSVTELNPARAVYDKLGFDELFHQVTVDLPGTWPPTGTEKGALG